MLLLPPVRLVALTFFRKSRNTFVRDAKRIGNNYAVDFYFKVGKEVIMLTIKTAPPAFAWLLEQGCISEKEIYSTGDGFIAVFKSLADILAVKGVVQFPDSEGKMLFCNRFFDDWYLYAVPYENTYVYSLFKLREQEHDAEEGVAADGDTPGVTVSFISFCTELLFRCLEEPFDENRKKLSQEINRVVAYRGQRHHKALKAYFKTPKSEGAYLIAALYIKHVSTFVKDGRLEVPEDYKETVRKSRLNNSSEKLKRLPQFIDSLNSAAGTTVCDHERIYINDPKALSSFECLAILATHTANVSFCSFAAEVEYHARFLLPIARLRIPFIGVSVYESAIRADMTIDDKEIEGPAPFYRDSSKIVRRQQSFHGTNRFVPELFEIGVTQ